MIRFNVLSIGLLSMAVLTSPVQAADEVGGRGQLFSAGATIAGGALTAVIVDLNAQADLVVTQFCKTGGDFGPQLSASNLGVIPSGGFGSGACQSYEPGVLVSGGQTLTCAVQFPDEFATYHCLVNGYLRGNQ